MAFILHEIQYEFLPRFLPTLLELAPLSCREQTGGGLVPQLPGCSRGSAFLSKPAPLLISTGRSLVPEIHLIELFYFQAQSVKEKSVKERDAESFSDTKGQVHLVLQS